MIGRGRPEADDRGQMILVAGVILAVLFVALALLVNAAIYTDNVATRGGDSAGEALEYQAGVVDSVGGLIDAENANESHATIGDIELAVDGGINEIDGANRQSHLRRGAATKITYTGNTESGLLLRESGANEFGNWEANASAVRGFVIDLDTSSMTDDSAFVIDLDGTTIGVKLNETDGEVTVSGGTENIDCAVSDDPFVRFDVTGERLGGEPCRFGWPALGTDSEIGIRNGANGGGSYDLTIVDEDAPTPTGSPPETTDALYSVELDLRIDTPELSYERTVRIAPGEPDV